MCAECRRIQPVFVVNITLGIVRFGDAESEVCDGRIICYGAVRLFGVDREERVFGIDREYRIYGNRVGGDWGWRAFRIRRVDREERGFGIDSEYRIYGNRVGGDWVWRAFRIRRG